MESSQDIEAELSFQKRLSARAGEIAPTSAAKLEEIRNTPSWRFDPRAYMYRQIRMIAPRSILVVGCGGGETAVRLCLLGYRVTAFDLSPEFVEITRRRAEVDGVSDRLEVTVGDAATISYPPESFDLILFELVLHHVPFRKTLENLKPTLAKNGRVLLFEPISLSPLLEGFRNLLPVHFTAFDILISYRGVAPRYNALHAGHTLSTGLTAMGRRPSRQSL